MSNATYNPCVNCGDDSEETVEWFGDWICDICEYGRTCGCKDCMLDMLYKMENNK